MKISFDETSKNALEKALKDQNKSVVRLAIAGFG